MIFLRLALTTILIALLAVPPGFSQLEPKQQPMPPQAVPGVEFTKIQDLKSDAPATNRPVKQKWAVVIGTSVFKERRLIPSENNQMDKSAKEFYDYLVDPEAGRFERTHVKLLLNSAATRQNIMTFLGDEWLGRATGPDDLLVVYVATNAFPTTDGNTYLCAYDCALDNIFGTCISMQSLMDSLRKSAHCDRILLVLQAAYSGAAELESGTKAIYSGYNIDLDKVFLGKGYVVLSSSMRNEITWGTVFSKNLISALRLENGMISLKKAFALARLETEKETAIPDPLRKQTPIMKSQWSGADLVLGTPPLQQVSQLPDSVTSFLSAESCYLKATKLITSGDTTGALREYEQAVLIDPNYADALSDYGAALALKGDWQRACAMYERCIAIRPDDELFHINYAQVLDKLGRAAECMKELTTAYNLNPKDTSVLIALANRYLVKNETKEAIRFLQEAIALYPANCDLHERLSNACAVSGDLQQALPHAREAVKLDPASLSARLNLGSVLAMSGDEGAASNIFDETAKMFPANADVHFLLSRSLEKRGQKQRAREELNRFVMLSTQSDSRLQWAKKHLLEM